MADKLEGVSYQQSHERWAAVGPYYAMFPRKFTMDVIKEYSPNNPAVFDPFAGRSSTVYAASSQGGFGVGVEINPVGWLYGKVKLCPANKESVIKKIKELGNLSETDYKKSHKKMSAFFRKCYCKKVLNFLQAARAKLNWVLKIDRTVMALILIYYMAKEGNLYQIKCVKQKQCLLNIRLIGGKETIWNLL